MNGSRPPGTAQPAAGTLPDTEIHELAGQGRLITKGFDSERVQQACYELCAGTEYFVPAEGNRHCSVPPGGDVLIKPKQLVIIITREYLDLPPDMLGRVTSKGSLFSVGLDPVSTLVDPGFPGHLGIPLRNIANHYVRIRPGTPIAKLELSRLPAPVRQPYRGQHGYHTGIWPLAERLIVPDHEVAHDPRVGTPIQEITRAYGPQLGSVVDRVFRFERILILNAAAFMLFSLLLIVLTRTPGGAQLSTTTAIGLGVASNVATSLLTFAATRLSRRARTWQRPEPR